MNNNVEYFLCDIISDITKGILKAYAFTCIIFSYLVKLCYICEYVKQHIYFVSLGTRPFELGISSFTCAL